MSEKANKIKIKNTTPPEGGFKMTIIPPGDPPHTRDELIAITIKVLTDMNDESRKHIATFITDLMLKNHKS